MSLHPRSDDLDGFLGSQGWPRNRTGNAEVVRHLLGRCPVCLGRLRGLGWKLAGGLTARQPELTERSADCRAESYNYSAAFEKAERALSSFFSPPVTSEQEPQKLLEELEETPSEHWQVRVGSDTKLQNVQFVEHLVTVAHSLRYQDPSKMLHFAELAQIAAAACSEAPIGGAERLADLRARAWSEYGNALRICGRHNDAEEAIEKAEAWRRLGTGDPLLRAALLEKAAPLRIAQRRFEEAIEQATEAGNIYRELGKPSLLASTMVQKAIAALYGGEPFVAATLLNSAIPLIDMEDDPHLLLAALHNLVRCYIDLGRPAEAMELYREARDIYRDFLDPILVLRAGWQEGQILRDLNRLDEAETELLRVRDGFLERHLPHDAALASLDLAEVYVRQKDFAALRKIIAAAVPVFHAIGATREILASWLQLQEVAHEEQRALEVVRDLARQLETVSRKTLAPAQ